MSHLTIILLSTLLAMLPANLAQDPIPTPIPTPEGGTCDVGFDVPYNLREGDTSIFCRTGGFAPPIYALECLSAGSDCQADHILGYGLPYFCGRVISCIDISLTRPLRSGEHIALYGPPIDENNCLWSVYRVYGAFSPRLYLPLLFR